MRKVTGILILIFLWTVLASANGVKLEPTGALADAGASQSLKDALEATGHRVILEDGSHYCDIWLRKALPVGAKNEAPGAIYSDIPPSALIGVIAFAKATTDFRGQAIKAGAYTLRYAIHPTDGNHLGISPIRDFLLLAPVADDQDVAAAPTFAELSKLSTKASATAHPAVISLLTFEGKEDVSIEKGELDRLHFSVKLKTTGAELPITFIVKGVAEQ